MADKITTVYTAGSKPGQAHDTKAIRLFGAAWINLGESGGPVVLGFFNYISGRFERVHDGWRSPWHSARIIAALKRHPECC